MVVEIRMYKRFDADLVALCDAGYPITTMLQNAIVSYANGNPVFYYIDEVVPFDMNGKINVHTRFTVPDTDVKTCFMLRHIKARMRNSFCKDVLRNALVQQNLSAYFTDPSLYPVHGANLSVRNIHLLPNVIPLSTIKRNREVNILGSTHVIKAKEAVYTHSPAYMNSPYGVQPMVQPAVQSAPQISAPQMNTNPFVQNVGQQMQGYQPVQTVTPPKEVIPAVQTPPSKPAMTEEAPAVLTAPTPEPAIASKTAGETMSETDLLDAFDKL